MSNKYSYEDEDDGPTDNQYDFDAMVKAEMERLERQVREKVDLSGRGAATYERGELAVYFYDL